MKRMGSGRETSGSKGSWPEHAGRRHSTSFVVCVDNSGYEVSLELRKLYKTLPDPVASSRGFLRIIDDSGEDYLYPVERFLPVELNQTVRRALLKAS